MYSYRSRPRGCFRVSVFEWVAPACDLLRAFIASIVIKGHEISGRSDARIVKGDGTENIIALVCDLNVRDSRDRDRASHKSSPFYDNVYFIVGA